MQNSADDWQARLAELEKQRSALDAQIRELKLTKTARTYEDYEIEERYQTVSGAAWGLLRDFREVEGNFRDITQRIYEQQSTANHTKGGLLGLALDALDELRLTNQGCSFEAFYRHLNDPRQRAELDALVRQVFELLHDRGLTTGDEFLRKIRVYLHGEGRKVNDSFYALARKLEKILSEKSLRDRRKSQLLINDIRALAFEVMGDPPKDPAFLELEGRADYLGTESTVALKERESAIVPRVLSVVQPAEPKLTALVSTRVVDKAALMANINALLRTHSQVTLRQVVAAHALCDLNDRSYWQQLEGHEAAVRAHFAQLGIVLDLNRAEGYARLTQPEPAEDDPAPPLRLLRRVPLSYEQALLCVVLREWLEEHESSAHAASPRLYATREQLRERIELFFRQQANHKDC